MKYMTKIGQNTGTLKQSNIVQNSPIRVDLTIPNQNLNSGRRLMKGRNSCVDLVGRSKPSSTIIITNMKNKTILQSWKYMKGPKLIAFTHTFVI